LVELRIRVQRQQALRGRRGQCRQVQRVGCHRRVLHLQPRAQAGDLGLLLVEFGAHHGRVGTHAGQVRVRGRGQRRAPRVVVAPARHQRLRPGQRIARLRHLGRRVLVGIGRIRARHGLLRGAQLGGGWRQAGATGQCGSENGCANQRVPGGGEVCEA